MLCPNCAIPISDNAKFCENCGTPITAPASPYTSGAGTESPYSAPTAAAGDPYAQAQQEAYQAPQSGYQQQAYQSGAQGTGDAYTQTGYTQPGYAQPAAPTAVTGQKSKIAAGLLAIFLGSLGIHKFYLGYTKPGVIMLLVTLVGFIFTLGLSACVMEIIGIIEGVIYLTKTDEDFYYTYELTTKEWF